MAIVEAAFGKWGWVLVGLTFGLAAKYALLLKRGVPFRWAMLLADVLLLPMVALIAYALASRLGVEPEIRALICAACTVGADRIVKLYTDRFYRQLEAALLRDVRTDLDEGRGELRQTVQIVESARAIVGRNPEDPQI